MIDERVFNIDVNLMITVVAAIVRPRRLVRSSGAEAEGEETVMGKIGIPELILFTIFVAAVLYLTRKNA